MSRPGLRLLRKSMGPPYYVGVDGEQGLIGYSLDLIKDAYLERVRLGLLYRHPEGNGVTAAPSDALAQTGKTRGIVRGISETDAGYAARLKRHLKDRRQQGTPWALMRQLQAYIGEGSSFRVVTINGTYCSLSTAGIETYQLGGTWNWTDADLSQWSRFWVVIYPGNRWGGHLWGEGGLYWGTFNWGLDFTEGQLNTLRAIIRKWKPAGTKCVSIIVATDGTRFDPASPEADASAVPSAIYYNGSQ